MKDEIKADVKKTYARWSKSETTNDVTTRLEVEECENGFVICLEKYGNFGKNKSWESITKKYISKTNPLEKEESSKMDEFDENIESLKSLFK